MIKILISQVVYDLDKNLQCRHCDIIITDNAINYFLSVGGLPLEGDLQPILDAQYGELLAVAIQNNDSKTNEQIRHLLYSAAWSSAEFQAAVIETIAENVGGSMPAFTDILELFEQINEAWPIQGEED